MKKIMLLLLFGVMVLTSTAQEKVYQIEEITVINYGDGRLLFRLNNEEKTPLNGSHRLIDGYHSEYILADFKDGMYHGNCRHFKENKLLEECRYKEGNRDGLYKCYYGDGQTVQSERTFIDGKVDGVSRTYHSNGKVETEKVYKLGIEDGYDRRYGSDGTLTLDECYKDGKRDGKWTQHLSSNLGDMVRISFYKNGLPDGQWSETWKDGKPEKSTTYKNDEKNGEEITYFTDGTPEKSSNYLNGKLNGVTKEFYFESGKCKSEYTFKNGKREGAYKRYFDTGKLREEGCCEADSEVYRKEYYANGKLKSVAERKGGGWNTIERYDSEGNKE
ncbi:toxin-antitoxin system YwqK family antitoxin [Bacteroides zhangwenhongii]|uniref:Toxin-antitoxin system YwqK family antitoxin n=1 Tax=Bacteroides zhangwenhongii TaxID=2650157 RepID=A0ABT5H7N6_9BACE|nr:toxin-antitoxin system YwqK family antitoxin [Bacteroides zhangwenhongii]MDC7135951.1 toxin-antitoxin system YwqK family antitoxin [Bacteroides zhangwenhongii]